jgi:hypothetical protein
MHIPVFAMAAFQARGVDARSAPGINDDDPLAAQDRRPGEPFMRVLRGATGLWGVFSGHDHGDDWCVFCVKMSSISQAQR